MDKLPIYQSNYSDSWALIIGINNYKHASPLHFATNDAKALAGLLEERYLFPKKNISVLLDKDADAAGIREAYFNFTKDGKMKADDRLLVFFAGYGMTVSGVRGETGFLVPFDGKPDNLATLIRWDDLTRNANLIPAKHIFFMMDACYGGLALLRTPAFGRKRFLGDMMQRYGRQVLTAGKAYQPVADGNGTRPGHSIFTSHLLDALEGAAATEDGVLSANGVMAYVYQRVGSDQYSQQTPHYGFIEGDGDFIFDLSPLEELRKESEAYPRHSEGGDKGDADILINTSPEIEIAAETGSTVIRTVKNFLPDPTKKIVLDDYISNHVRKFLAETDLRHFPVQESAVTKEDFIERLGKYEFVSKDLQEIVILLATYGNEQQTALLEKIFTRVAEADKGNAGLVMWLHLTWYPLQILMYSAGIAALASRNYKALKIILTTLTQVESSGKKLPLVVSVGANMTDLADHFKWIPGQERKYVPRSEHLLKVLQPTLEDILLLGRSYEALFDDFEILSALSYAWSTKRNWGPPGRFAWKHKSWDGESPFKILVDEADKEKNNWGPISAGLFGGSFDDFAKTANTYRVFLDGLSWW